MATMRAPRLGRDGKLGMPNRAGPQKAASFHSFPLKLNTNQLQTTPVSDSLGASFPDDVEIGQPRSTAPVPPRIRVPTSSLRLLFGPLEHHLFPLRLFFCRLLST